MTEIYLLQYCQMLSSIQHRFNLLFKFIYELPRILLFGVNCLLQLLVHISGLDLVVRGQSTFLQNISHNFATRLVFMMTITNLAPLASAIVQFNIHMKEQLTNIVSFLYSHMHTLPHSSHFYFMQWNPHLMLLTLSFPSFNVQFQWFQINNLIDKLPPFKIFLCLMLKSPALQRNHKWGFRWYSNNEYKLIYTQIIVTKTEICVNYNYNLIIL